MEDLDWSVFLVQLFHVLPFTMHQTFSMDEITKDEPVYYRAMMLYYVQNVGSLSC